MFLLLTLTGQDGGTLVTLGLHLLLHRLEHTLRRRDVLQLHTVHLDTPLVGGIIEHGTELGVDGIARSKGLIQLHLSDDVTQGGLGQLLYGVRQVVDFIHALERIHNLEIKQCINLHLDIILGNHILSVEVIHLFTKIDVVGIGISTPTHRHDGLRLVDERDNDVDTRLQGGIVATQSLDNLGLTLGNDDDGFLYHNQCK